MGKATADFDPQTGSAVDRTVDYLVIGDPSASDASKDKIITFDEALVALRGPATALGNTGIVSLDPELGDVFTTAPSGDMTINAASALLGARVSIVVTTPDTTSRTLTFGTSFKTAGTLVTGTVASKVFTISFVGDGTNLNEVSRTAAM